MGSVALGLRNASLKTIDKKMQNVVMQPFPPVQAIKLAEGNTRQLLSKKITHLLESCFPR